MACANQSNQTLPNQVPEHLLWNHSFVEYIGELDDPFIAASRLHEGPPIIWAKDTAWGNPGWVLTRHALIQEAFRDYEHFASVRGSSGNFVGADFRLIPLEFDPPEHHAYRHILNPYFAPRAVKELDTNIRELCDSLISAFAEQGSCEFVSAFSEPFPTYIFLALMGMPQAMAPRFLDWKRTLVHSKDVPKRIEAAKAIMHYLQEFIAEQRINPQTELMRGIVSGQLKTRPLNEGEMLGMCYLLYVAGLDTVYSSLGWIMRHLASDQPLQERLRSHPEDIPAAVDELTRAFGIVATHRTVVKDFSFHGVEMRKGDDVLLPTYLAARDPEAYENPHTVDIARRAGSVTFATGPHSCIGIHLAKREIRIVIEAFLARCRNIRIPEGETYRFCTSGVLGVEHLKLIWDR